MCLGRRTYAEFYSDQLIIDLTGDTSTESPSEGTPDTDTTTTDTSNTTTTTEFLNNRYINNYGIPRKRLRLVYECPNYSIEFVPESLLPDDLRGLVITTEQATTDIDEDLQSQDDNYNNHYAKPTSLWGPEEEEEVPNVSSTSSTTPSELADPTYMPPRSRTSTSTEQPTYSAGISRRITRAYARSYVQPSAYCSRVQKALRLQPLNPSTAIVDKTTKSYVGGRQVYQEGYNCWTVKPIDKKRLIVNQIRKRVCFTEETIYQSSYTDKVNRRDKPVREKDTPIPLIVWVRTCENFLFRQEYNHHLTRRFPYCSETSVRGLNILEYSDDILPGRITTHLLDIDQPNLEDYRTFHPKPDILEVRNLPFRYETDNYLVVYASDLPSEVVFPFSYPYYPETDARIF
jgi:hypothetical protein